MSSNNDQAKTSDIRRTTRRPWSLALRLTIWYAGSAFALVLIATGILYWVLVTNLDQQDDQFLVDEVHILQDLLAERPEYVDAIRQEVEWEAAARRYARVYERLLDSKGRTVSETPDMSDMLPRQVFPDAAADEAGVALVMDCRSGWIANIARSLFQRAVSNLLSNAIQHTPAGGKVQMQAEVVADELVVQVTDTGEGISPAMLPHVFDRFFQADNSR